MNKPKYIRAHLDIPDWILAEGLNETLFYIESAKVVAIKSSLKKQRTCTKSIYEQMTNEMQKFILELGLEDKATHQNIKTAFNYTYQNASFTPISSSTASRCVKTAMKEMEFGEDGTL